MAPRSPVLPAPRPLALAAALLVGLAAPAGPGARPAAASQPERADPAPLSPRIFELTRTYSPGSAHPYVWKKGTHTDGTTLDIRVQGISLATVDDGVHCSGVTWEVWLRAMKEAGGLDSIGPAQLLALKDRWYIREGSETGFVDALVELGLGQRIERLEDLRPGDLVQFWRNSGKGHSAVFVSARYGADGRARGMVYWSAQSSSEGIGQRIVSVGDGEHQISPGRWYAVRPIHPTVR
jgi:hypothetical protein